MLSGLRKFFGRKAETSDDAIAHYRSANVMRDQGELEAALAGYDRAIDLDASHAHALCNRGVVLQRLHRFEAAIDSFDRSIALDPVDFLAHFNRAAVLLALKRPQEALAGYDRAIEIKPDYVEAYCNRGNLLAELDRQDAALADYDRSIEINPGFYHAYMGRGTVLQKRKQWEAALGDYECAVQINSQSAEAYAGRGMVLTLLRRWEPAFDSFSRAMALSPELAETHAGRGFLFAALNRSEQAKTDFDAAIALKPDYVDALLGRADAHYHLKKFEEARADYDRALAFDPDRKFLLGMCLLLKMQVCDWSHFARDREHLIAAIEAGQKVTAPFPALALLDSARLHQAVAMTWAHEECPSDPTLGPIRARLPRAKIHVGYFSSDFRTHAVSMLTAELFETHDRSVFEITAFAFGPEAREDALRARLERAFDRFIDVRDQSDAQVAMLARSLGIDIAVDLGGFTGHGRPCIFAMRAAPVQISYLGYLGTLGASHMDYLLADPTIIPPETRPFYTEKIIYLPSYQVNDSKRRIAARRFSREELGLPAHGFVFACFNANYKIMPATFAVWMRVLQRVEGSVLFLNADSLQGRQNLIEQARGHGIDARRLVFNERLPVEEYLARFRVMDLFLDTLPYNAGTTASDALWVGLPVLTCLGNAFAGRVAASLLRAVGLPELVTGTVADYEEMAVKLATDPDLLEGVRRKLAHNLTTTPLFDTVRFTRSLESAYAQVHERSQAELPPDHVFISWQDTLSGHVD